MVQGYLAQSPSFTFRFQKSQDVSFTNWALDISDDGSVAISQELNFDLLKGLC